MKLSFFKAFGFFLLLIAADTGFAFTSPEGPKDLDREVISYELSEDIQDLSQSILTGPSAFDSLRILSHGTENFYFQSTYIAGIATRYITYSRSIDPGLTVSKIIFPFHSFI